MVSSFYFLIPLSLQRIYSVFLDDLRLKSLISGQWKNAGGVAIPSLSLDSSITTAFDAERKRLFLEFIKSMLQWLPEKRKTASELLRDPWLNAKCIVE